MVRRVSGGPQRSPTLSPRSILKSSNLSDGAPREPSLSRPVLASHQSPGRSANRTPSPQTARIESMITREPHTLQNQPPLGLRQSPRTPSPGRIPWQMMDRQSHSSNVLRRADVRGSHPMRSPSPHSARMVRINSPPRTMQVLPQTLSAPSPGIKASPDYSGSRSRWDCGIGVQLVKCPSGDIEVLAVREGSNAGEAGVYAGDRLLSVNGSDVSGLDCLQVGMTESANIQHSVGGRCCCLFATSIGRCVPCVELSVALVLKVTSLLSIKPDRKIHNHAPTTEPHTMILQLH